MNAPPTEDIQSILLNLTRVALLTLIVVLLLALIASLDDDGVFIRVADLILITWRDVWVPRAVLEGLYWRVFVFLWIRW